MMIVININDNDDGYNYGDTPLPCSTEKEVNHLPLSHTAKDPASLLFKLQHRRVTPTLQSFYWTMEQTPMTWILQESHLCI